MTIIVTLPAHQCISAEIITAYETASKSQSPHPPHEADLFGSLVLHSWVTIQPDLEPSIMSKASNIPSIQRFYNLHPAQ